MDSILRAVLVRPVLRAPGVDADASSVVAVAPSPSTAVVLAGRPEKSSPGCPRISHESSKINRTSSPSLINSRRPSRFRSDKVIATSFASGVAKSTYAKLPEGNLMSFFFERAGRRGDAHPEFTLGPAPLGDAFKGMCSLVTSNPSKKFFKEVAVVL